MQSEDVHPLCPGATDRTLEQRLLHLENIVSQLWDQVWWLSLPVERRALYESQGHKAPIIDFYGPGSSERP